MTAAEAILAETHQGSRQVLRAALSRERRRRKLRRCTWRPQPGAQQAAFDTLATELLYGGAAGGGKTDLILGAARMQAHRALILRRTVPELQKSVTGRSEEIYATKTSQYSQKPFVWKFPGENVRIDMGGVQHEKDVKTYLGGAYDFIGFDEGGEFTRSIYMFLLSRLRSVRDGQHCRVIAATNPVGEGVEFFMERWAPWLTEGHPDPEAPGALRWFIAAGDGLDIHVQNHMPITLANMSEQIVGKVNGQALTDGDLQDVADTIKEMTDERLLPTSRTFIPAKLGDNQYLGDEYRAQLMALPKTLRDQMLHGDWQAGLADDAYQVIPTKWIKAAMARWVAPTGTPDCIGVDVARGGADKTAFAPRYGDIYGEVVSYPGVETPDGNAVFVKLAQLVGSGAPMVNMDEIGVGAGAVDIANERGQKNFNAVSVATATDRRDLSGRLRFANLRTALWWQFRESLDPDCGSEVALPPSAALEAELRSARYDFGSGGVIRVTKKDKQKEILGRSPDLADAVLLASYTPDRVFHPDSVAEVGVASAYAPPAHAKLARGVAYSRVEGHRVVHAAKEGAITHVYEAFTLNSSVGDVAKALHERQQTNGVNFLAILDGSDALTVRREFGLAGIRCRSGFDEVDGLGALGHMVDSKALVIHVRAVEDALAAFRMKKPNSEDGGGFVWQGDFGYVRALFDLARYFRFLNEARAPKAKTSDELAWEQIRKKNTKRKATFW